VVPPPSSGPASGSPDTAAFAPFVGAFAVPALLAGPVIALAVIVALQLAGGAAFLPLVRRWLSKPRGPWATHRRQL
jgi:hypothetical protein